MNPAASALDRAARYRERYRATVARMVRDLPAEPLPAPQVRAHLEQLREALTVTGRRGMNTPGSEPATRYGAALAVMGESLGAFLTLEPEPHTCAVLFMSYTATLRYGYTGSSPEAAALLEGADAGHVTAADAGRALSAFPDVPTLTAFLGAHHAFSLAVEALGDPDTDPAGKLADALETVRREVLALPTSPSLTA